MRIDPDHPSFFQALRGQGDRWVVGTARVQGLVAVFVLAFAFFALAGIR